MAIVQVSAQSDGGQKWTPTWADRLKKDLLKDYDPSLRPSQHYNVTTVETSITITHVEINEIKSTLSVYGWMKFNWTDIRLGWIPEQYENKTYVYLNHTTVWHPSDEPNTLVKVSSTGHMLHVSTFDKNSKCTLEWKKWPFDTQHCKMLFSPWLEREDMELGTVLMQYVATQGTLWSLRNVSLVTYVSEDGNATTAERGTYLLFEMERNSPIYRSTIIAPACVLMLMNLINFWLPPDSNDKLVLNGISMFVTCLFLMQFNEHLAYYTSATPTIVLFYSRSLYLSGVCLLITVAIDCMLKTGNKVQIPSSVKTLITNYSNACMIATNQSPNKADDQMCDSLDDTPTEEAINYMEEMPSSGLKKSNFYQDWLLFATLLNRIAFVIYLVIYSFMMLCYF
ncbi:neuronal acetylcholine receptor subunit eat-2-like [Anopheles ziemanni]|uniref:neuronal acetylcholine receptor subunit eat-2-like n=1 Tax=Anopheles ziemanni TaxID=345580 RepID=UPI00265F8685|nr:neuronal acetylcholine receptor subunit eat-2-like [Anopheles ziemanni]